MAGNQFPHISRPNVVFDMLLTEASLVVQMVRNLPAMWETWVRFLGRKIPWRREWQPTLVSWPGESPWTEEPGGLQSMGSQRVGMSDEHSQRNHLWSDLGLWEGTWVPFISKNPLACWRACLLPVCFLTLMSRFTGENKLGSCSSGGWLY